MKPIAFDLTLTAQSRDAIAPLGRDLLNLGHTRFEFQPDFSGTTHLYQLVIKNSGWSHNLDRFVDAVGQPEEIDRLEWILAIRAENRSQIGPVTTELIENDIGFTFEGPNNRDRLWKLKITGVGVEDLLAVKHAVREHARDQDWGSGDDEDVLCTLNAEPV